MAIANGVRLAEVITPVTVAASPFLSAWIDTTGCTQALGVSVTAGGTTVATLEYGTDGSAADADFAPTTLANNTTIAPFVLVGPYCRLRVVQSVADATKTKIYLQARA